MPATKMDRNLISQEQCLVVIKEFLKSSDFQVKSYKILPFHKLLEGLIGEHFTLEIEFEHNAKIRSQKFFLKTIAHSNKVMFEIAKSIDVFGKEKFFYTYILKEFEKYSIDTSFSPEGYLFVPYIVVLEDLGLSGFKGTKKRAPLDLDHCNVCMEIIAKFHSGGIIYEKKKSLELGRKFNLYEEFPDFLEDKFMSKADNGATRYLRSAINGLFQLIDLIPENHVSREEFKQRLGEVLEELVSTEPSEELVSTILHADLWSSNLLYIYDESGKPVKGKIVDYQMIKYGPPQLDLIEFLMTNTRREFRDKNFDVLIEHYYKTLSDLLNKAGLDSNEILPRSGFFRACDVFKVAGKVHAIVDRSVTFMPDETYRDVIKSEETFEKFLFEERGKYIIDCYNRDEDYKSLLLEDVLELRDLLFPCV